MNNTIIQQLTDRKSVRIFEDRPILPEERAQIIHAAMEAPTAGNQQLYTILDITDPALKEQLSVSCDHQPFIAKAPLVLIFCADCLKWLSIYEEAGCLARRPGAGDLLLAVSDTAIAAQNAVTAAWSLGIGSCYIGDIMEQYETHRRILDLPKYVFPAAMVVFGYPTEQQKARPKPQRFPASDIVCENTYHVKNGKELRQMLTKECSPETYDQWVTAFCNRKYNSDFSKEMTRSVEKYLKDFGV